MTTVTLTVGVQASGKSTWARAQGLPIVCRDDIRNSLGVGHAENEKLVTEIANAQIEGLALAGRDFIIADTNLNAGIRNRLIKMCHRLGVDVRIKTFPITQEEAIARDAQRGAASVGPDVIKAAMARFESQKIRDHDLPVPTFTPYQHVDGKGLALVVDIDGTVANHSGVRSPYDYLRVSEDKPIWPVVHIVNRIISGGSAPMKLVFSSGRKHICYEDTMAWLNALWGDCDFELYMRPADDERPDWVVKNEMYDKYILPKYNVFAVLDDRDQVVKHLRNRGLTVLQVAEGHF